MNEASLLQSISQTLYTAVLSDVLDELGFREQAMPPSIRPLDDDLVMVGRARTGVYREVYSVVAGDNPYALPTSHERASNRAPARVTMTYWPTDSNTPSSPERRTNPRTRSTRMRA